MHVDIYVCMNVCNPSEFVLCMCCTYTTQGCYVYVCDWCLCVNVYVCMCMFEIVHATNRYNKSKRVEEFELNTKH